MSTPPPAQDLPKVLERLKDVRSEAAELRTFTITFLSLLLYINIIIASTNAEQILRIAPVTLPLLSVPLPIVAFYGFVPWLLVLFHLYLLVQHYLFSQQLFLFKNVLDDPLAVSDDIRKHVRKNLGNLPFLHWMIGKHSFPMRGVLTLTTLIYLLIWPLLTLLWLQIAIMPYHSTTLIWVQRFAIILDVLLVSWLWSKTLDSNDSSCAWWWRGVGGWWYVLFFLPRCLLWLLYRIPIAGLWSRVVSLLPSRLYYPLSSGITKTVLVLTLPTILVLEWMIVVSLSNARDYFIPICLLLLVICRMVLYVTVVHPANLWLTVKSTLPKVINTSTLPLGLGLFITLFLSLVVATLPDSGIENFITGYVNSSVIKPKEDSLWLKVVDVEENPMSKLKEMITTRMAFAPTAWLHEQHKKTFEDKEEYQEELLKGAKTCPSLDKPNTNADNKSDTETEEDAEKCLMVQPLLPRNLILREKVLTDAPKLDPELEAKLQTNVPELVKTEDLVKVRGLNLQSRNFDYADFTKSSLPKVDLSHASLKHAVLSKTRLEQADLHATKLEEANLLQAKLFGAKLRYADLSGAALHRADLSGADMNNAKLLGANLYYANLSGAKLDEANLSGALLNSTNLSGAKLDKANLSGAWLNGEVNLLDVRLKEADLSGTCWTIDTEDKLRKKIIDAYRKKLMQRFDSQDKQSQKNIEDEINKFENQVKQQKFPNFSEAKQLKTCIYKSETGTLLPDCKKESDNKLGGFWKDLACDDNTKGHRLAKGMVIRAKRDFYWFAKPLLKAAQDRENCKGLAWLSKEDKASLQKVVDEETKKSAGN